MAAAPPVESSRLVAAAAADALADPERVGRGDLLTAAAARPPDDAIGE